MARSSASGSLPKDLRGDVLDEARRHFFDDFHAPSTRDSVAAKWKTILKMLELQGLSPFPPSVAKVHALGVALKFGRYRSAAGYLSQYRVECERRGFFVDQLMQRAIRDSTRSCLRGLGGPVRALPLPFDRLRLLPGSRAPWSPLGPVSPRNLIVLGSWFMVREVEAAHTLAEHVTVKLDSLGRPRVEWFLPVSKTDQEAVGALRVHGCSCISAADPSCPGHAAWDHLTYLKGCFGVGVGQARVLPPGVPMFPNEKGEVCTKEQMTVTIEEAAKLLKIVWPRQTVHRGSLATACASRAPKAWRIWASICGPSNFSVVGGPPRCSCTFAMRTFRRLPLGRQGRRRGPRWRKFLRAWAARVWLAGSVWTSWRRPG